MTKSYIQRILLVLVFSCSTPLFAQTHSQALNSKLSVSGQMTTEKFSTLLKQSKFKSVIVNRPDEELGNETSVLQLRSIAEKSHVSVVYQPVVSGKISQTDVREFAKYYNELPKPILMICRSGSRSTALFNQAQAQGLLND
ncbi:hypothetical protein B9T33_08385 [Acinetobacter sp. ANC 5054]|uniref:beta-lactamase hydrolase domain-containing protein n=1 Tax=Acinetobacter sp. ANC 5054 TaxID=1977877 RepID=UPI000A34AE3C|nr:sulfur transferase domain-containing protein [Acinetobacter sp. ANC 5054]OTG80984.1 hypothetical protein B9T33_08385 [Acinetobacter sp. ANC 5054]